MWRRRTKTVNAGASTFDVVITDWPDKTFLLAEIFAGENLVAVIDQEQEERMIEIFPRSDGTSWVLPFDDLLTSLRSAGYSLDRTVRVALTEDGEQS